MKLKNRTIYNYDALINGNKYRLKSGDVITFECEAGTNVQLICTNKSYVHLDWLDILILGMFIGSTTITGIYANYSFDIIDPNEEIIELDYNDWCIRSTININSVYAMQNVSNEQFSLPTLKKTRKKHKLLHMFVSNALPVGITDFILCFFYDPPYLFIILLILWLLLFELPSLKERKRFRQIMDGDELCKKLDEYAKERRIKPFVFGEDTSKTGKIFEKILDKMFKFGDKDK